MNNIEVLISEEKIEKRISELAEQINKDYEGEELLIVSVLRGAVVFTCDLIRKLTINVKVDFMVASSYQDSTESSGKVKIEKDLDESIKDRNILIIDDIVDTGLTLSHLVEILKTRGPKSIALCALCSKKERRTKDVKVNYIGFEVPDLFIVGYGLDYKQQYRNLPYIGRITD